MNVAQLLEDATVRIATALGLEKREARLEARVLASHSWGVDAAWLIAHDTDVLSIMQTSEFQSLLSQRLAGQPIAYLVGWREFYGRPFEVTPAVLIPRPDTELLVEAALQHLPTHTPCRILELGTGSGIIAITLACQRPMAEVVAVEASVEALAIAKINARRLGAENVSFVAGSWYSELNVNKFDMIVANPPYIAAADPHLDAGDLRFEPRKALASGSDGLRDLCAIITGAPTHLVRGGWLMLEHGFDQASAVVELLQHHGFKQTCTRCDLAGLNRVSGGCWPGRVKQVG